MTLWNSGWWPSRSLGYPCTTGRSGSGGKYGLYALPWACDSACHSCSCAVRIGAASPDERGVITSLSGGVDSDSYPATEVESLPATYGSVQHCLKKVPAACEYGVFVPL